jgi:hypothetical protein
MPYDISTNGNLSDAASALPAAKLDAQTRTAARLLGLSSVLDALTDEQRLEAEDAIAIQVSMQVAAAEGEALESEQRGERQVKYRSAVVSAKAKAIADALLADLAETGAADPEKPCYPVLRSFR